MAVDSSGNLAYVTDAVTGFLRTYSISSQTGAWSPVGAAYAFAGDQPNGVAFDPLGAFAFTADGAAASTVSMFRIQPNRSVTLSESELVGADPSAVAADYSGRFVVVVTTNGQVLTYAIDRDLGTLSFVSSEGLNGISTSGAPTLSTHAE